MTLGMTIAVGMLISLGAILGVSLIRQVQLRKLGYRGVIFGFMLVALTSCASDPLPSLPQQRAPLTDTNARSIVHAMGKIQVPEKPVRVVTVDTAALDAAIALGTTPVGSIIFQDFPDYLGDQTAGITSVGDGKQPNFETILSLKPDLILGSKIGSEKHYKNLNRIAPTVLTEGSGRSGDWQQNFKLYAEALNKTDQADHLLNEYQQAVAQLRNRIGDTSQVQVSVVATGQGRVGVYSVRSFSGVILKDIGFERPPQQAREKSYAKLISREDLDSLDGDIIYLIKNANRSARSIDREQFMAEKLWANLKAVRDRKVYDVNSQVWTAGRSILAANQILEDVAQAFPEADTPQND